MKEKNEEKVGGREITLNLLFLVEENFRLFSPLSINPSEILQKGLRKREIDNNL